MINDLRQAVRSLAGSPGFTLAVVLSLGLGIGLNTAIFSVVDSVLLRPAPVAGLDRLVMVWETDRNTGTSREPASLPDFVDFRERSQRLSDVVAMMADEVNLTPPAGDPARLAGLKVTDGVLPLLGVTPVLGRAFTPAEAQPGAPAVAIISTSLWRRVFNTDPAVLGQTLRLDDVPHEVVGVVPDSTDFGILQILTQAAYARSFADRGVRTRVDLWTPLSATAEELPRSTHPIFVVGRLAPGATVDQAQTELAAVAADLERMYPENAARGVNVESLSHVVFGPVRPALLVLWAGVALVLLVACVNVANLLLARGTARRREVAIRSALGSGTARLLRHYLVETLVLTGLACAAGVAIAFGALGALVAQAPPDVPRLHEIAIDLRVLLFAIGVSVLVAVVFAFVPALQAMGVDPNLVLRADAGRGTLGSRAGVQLRRGLVVGEVALAVVLVIAAGLLARSFWTLRQVDPGFRSEGVIKAEYQLPPSRYPIVMQRFPDFPEAHAFTRRLLDRVASLPGVEAAAIAGNHPLDPGFTNSFGIVGRSDEQLPEITVRRVTPDYFSTVGLDLVDGRVFAAGDDASAPTVSIVNEAAAARLFGPRNPIGEKIRMWGSERTIVGVVRNERFQGIAESGPIGLYLPLGQAPSTTGAGVLLVRGSNPDAIMPAARAAIREIDPALAVFGLEPLDDTVSRSTTEQRFMMLLLVVFAAMALVIAALGVHGVLSYGIARRTQEIGVRLALGAEPRQLRRQVMGEALLLTGIGGLLGAAGAIGAASAIRGLLFGVSPTDPWTFVAVPLLLAGVGILTSAAAARRVTAIDPVDALRA